MMAFTQIDTAINTTRLRLWTMTIGQCSNAGTRTNFGILAAPSITYPLQLAESFWIAPRIPLPLYAFSFS
jgi:hypothetical protein